MNYARSKVKWTKKTSIVVAVAALITVGVVVGIALYRDRVAPFRHVIVRVGEAKIRMDTFLHRTYMADAEPVAMLRTLAREQIIRLEAAKHPYNIEVSDAEVEEYLRTLASGLDSRIGEDEYREWLRQQLNETGLDRESFLSIAETRVMARELQAYLGSRVPTVVEQVRLAMIETDDYQTGEDLWARIQAGEEFASVARDASRSNADLGWSPRLALDRRIARIAFDELGVGQMSRPELLEEGRYVLIKVLDRAAAREMDDETLAVVRSGALDRWLDEVTSRYEIEYGGFNGSGYDSDTDAWVQWQLQRMDR